MTGQKTVIVIPTYNEKGNIVELIDAISALAIPADILVVDDNSPDGTGALLESAKETRQNLLVIHRRKKEGIGPAYIEAFRYLLKEERYDYIVQMDADFSHNPKDIPALLAAAKNCGVAVGSRYIKGGGITDRWKPIRKYISRLGNIYARFVTGLKVMDCTGGFRCYGKKALKSLDLDKIFLDGYGFQIQMLYELNKNNVAICEIPIFFDERREGASKMNLGIVWEAFFSLLALRLKDGFKA